MEETTILAKEDHFFDYRGESTKCITKGNMYVVKSYLKTEVVVYDDEGDALSLLISDFKDVFGEEDD